VDDARIAPAPERKIGLRADGTPFTEADTSWRHHSTGRNALNDSCWRLRRQPVTGERLVFHPTPRDTGGEYCFFETFVEPGGLVAQAHVHPFHEGPVGELVLAA
jgi:hypothetical protein